MKFQGTWRTIIIIVLAGIVGIGVGKYLGSSRTPSGSTASPAEGKKGNKGGAVGGLGDMVIKLSAEQKQTLRLKVEPVELRVPEESLAVTGRIAANLDRAVIIGPRTTGRAVKVLVRLGQMVNAGESLAFLDSVEAADAMAELAQNESALALAQARAEKERQLFEAKMRVLEAVERQESAAAAEKALEQVELGRLKQEYIGALARLELARANYDRQKLLVERKIGARKDLIEGEKALIAARGELGAVAETIRLTARQDLLAVETALHQARSQRDKVREKLRLLGVDEATLAEAGKAASGQRALVPLVAPFSGTVIERQVVEGQLIDPGFVAFRLADLSTVWALLDIPETETGRLKLAQEVAIETGGELRRSQTGRVSYIGDVIDEQTRTVKVRVELPNPERHFKPGMFVTAQITTRRSGPPMILLPSTALFLLDEGPVVFVEDRDEIRPRPVERGPQMGGWIIIRQGLRAGEKVVTEGGFAVKAQMLKSRLGED
jgi:cobalt-zinc-cadmium efflux system membrane fusion protein